MDKTIECHIVSAEQAVFSGPITLLIASGTEGELGINAGHSPLLSQLKPGPVRLLRGINDEEIYYLSGGFLEVQPDSITVLADTAIRADDVDEASAKLAMEKAEQLLADTQANKEYSHVAIELAEAVAKLRTVEQLRKRLSSK